MTRVRDAVARVARLLGFRARPAETGAFVDPGTAELRLTLDYVVAHRMMVGGPNLFVVQVGAYDGVSGDPIHHFVEQFSWRGVLVEPQPEYFAKLEATYAGNGGIAVRQVAVAAERGTRSLYYVSGSDPDDPEWVGQLASFDPSTISGPHHKGLVPRLEERIDSVEVECVTFEDLLRGVERVDFLQVDVEGFDAEIIKLFDFERWQPSIVNFENKHLSTSEHKSAVQHLVSYGYQVAQTGEDTVGYKPPCRGASSSVAVAVRR